ncbi:protein tyrosine phosphatase, mitochondrial 1 isoform X2 [Tachypleus tridentatus]|uniref:protein tyrosine phosphatase, mitochondrial 1 isoform X2 n=1 Tax=Tachypleus tridentatus TaxID=6853 RepID=UPI003FD63724
MRVIGIFSRITFYPTLFYNMCMEKVSSRMWYNRIDDVVILGALPLRHITPKLIHEEKVKGVVSMNEDYELRFWVTTKEEWLAKNVEFLQLNTMDIFQTPSQEKLKKGVSFIKSFENTGNSVYVHCKAGRTRSATLVGCYLMEKHGWNTQEAVEFIRSRRHHILLGKVQWKALQLYHQKHVQK